jgi:hypothetical protein
MQVDPIKPALKAPGTKRLKLEYDGPVSKFAFKISLPPYNKDKTVTVSGVVTGLDKLPIVSNGVVTGYKTQGKAVQVEPMRSKLKAHGTERLKLSCDKLLSTVAFKFSLRRYTKGTTCRTGGCPSVACACTCCPTS